MGTYDLTVHYRRAFQPGGTAASMAPATVVVEPILAAGKLSDQSGTIAIAKADTLAISVPATQGLIPCDPGSEADLPYAPHRQGAVMAFKYTAPPWELSLPVAMQKEAEVFTRIATAAVIEQVIDRKGTLNTHATYLLATSRGDRLAIQLPPGAKIFSVLLNGAEAAVERGANPDERILRLPPSSGQVSKLVVEVSYGLDNASAGDLRGPELVGDIPVQETLWRLWVPQEDYLLGYDRTFARLDSYQAGELMNSLASGQPMKDGKPVGPSFKLAAQGVSWDFIRQGPPGKLSVSLVGKEFFNITIWVLVLAAGAVMLRVNWFTRLLVILAAMVVGAVVHLFRPLLTGQVADSACWAAFIVLVLWAGHWLFVRRRHAGKPARPAPAPAAGSAKGPGPSQTKEAGHV
jgi:hypothetical protein